MFKNYVLSISVKTIVDQIKHDPMSAGPKKQRAMCRPSA